MPYKDPEARRVYNHVYHQTHKPTAIEREALNAYQREWKKAWREANREKHRAFKKEDYAKHREVYAARARAHRAAVASVETRAKERERAIRRKEESPDAVAYNKHKCSAARRGIPFLLTFNEWVLIWTDSGKREQRGRFSAEYCMARHGDSGPYAIGNVRICTNKENAIERNTARRGKPGRPHSDATRKKLSDMAKARHGRGTASV